MAGKVLGNLRTAWRTQSGSLTARGLDDHEKVGNVKVAGATPMWEWAGDDTTVFSY